MIRSETLAERIEFEGTRAVGATIRRGERREVVRARRELVVCTGTLLTPRLLMLSGVGPAAHLGEHGIPVVADNPHVGRHMRDHVGLRIGYRLQGAAGSNASLRMPRLIGTIARYLLFRSGLLATTGEVGAFVRAHPEAMRPDGQLMLSAMSQSAPRVGAYMGPVEKLPGLSAHACVLDADSEGSITLASANPAHNPRIQPNALSSEHDRLTLLNLVKIVRRLVAQPAIAPYIAHEAFPGMAIGSDEEILAYAERTARNFNHAVGTCRLGSLQTGAVDARLRVHGVQGLRVADCSIMPSLPAGNTNGPAQMVGWRAAELIREDARG